MNTFFRNILKESAFFIFLSIITAFCINGLRSDRLPLIGNWSPEGRIVSKTGENMVISIENAKELFAAERAFFIDARSAEEFGDGHIQGAMSLPWNDFNRLFNSAAPEIPTDKPIIVYCDGETCNLSKELASALEDLGYADVRVLINGWSIWQQHGLPIGKSGQK